MYKSSFLIYNRKITRAGNVLTCVETEKPVFKGYKDARRKGRANAKNTTESTKRENRAKIAARARRTVRNTVNANPQLNKFLTLTYKANICDIKHARHDWDIYIKRVKRRYPSFQFVCVIEFQKRGAIHFHVACNLPYVSVNDFANIWKNGFIKLNKIDNIDNVGSYISKYMSKDNLDDRLIGNKCYTMSKGLNRPEEITDEDEIDEILSSLENVVRVYMKEYESEYYGKMKYTQIVLKRSSVAPHARKRLTDTGTG